MSATKLARCFGFFVGDDKPPSAAWWPERLAAVLAVFGVMLSLLPGFQLRQWQDAASDFKTVYASGKLFLYGRTAYNFPNIETVFHQYGVVVPRSWYAHAPIYPPFTYATLAPLLTLPMVTSAYVWMFLSALSLVYAIWALADRSEWSFGLSRTWRLLLVLAVGTLQVVSFSLFLGNLNVVAAALCVTAVMYTGSMPPYRVALLMALSLLLKPHIALFLLAGMILSRSRQDRALAVRALAFFAGALAIFTIIFFHRQLGIQWGGYIAMVRAEIAGGSMGPHNNELLNPQCEITSLESLLGYFLPDLWSKTGSLVLIVVMSGTLIYATRQRENNLVETRLELLGAWSALGLLATYHRTNDSMVLFVLLPWVLVRWKRKLSDPVAWAVLLPLVAMGSGSFPPTFEWLNRLGLPRVARFAEFRQSAMLTAVLMLVLLVHLLIQGRVRTSVATK